MCSFLKSKVVLKTVLDALFKFKSKDKYERKMLNRLKRNFKTKIYINSFCFCLAPADEQMVRDVTLKNFADTRIYDEKAKLVPMPRERRERG